MFKLYYVISGCEISQKLIKVKPFHHKKIKKINHKEHESYFFTVTNSNCCNATIFIFVFLFVLLIFLKKHYNTEKL